MIWSETEPNFQVPAQQDRKIDATKRRQMRSRRAGERLMLVKEAILACDVEVPIVMETEI
jgi:hypothetical protein